MAKRTRWTKMNKQNTPITKLREQFIIYNKTTGKSPATISWYEQKLELFTRFIGTNATLADVTVANARSFIADLQERSTRNLRNPYNHKREGALSSSYVQGFARALRAFSSWLHEDGYTENNVLKTVKLPKIQQKVADVLTDGEVKDLVGAFDQDEPFGARNFALVWTMLDCGLRAGELCGLRIGDAHLEDGYLKVLGKGNKERLVPIGQHCASALMRWRDRFRSQFEVIPNDYLFLNANGEVLTVNALEEVVKRAGARAGVARVHCHLLRHTFATAFIAKEVGDPLRLQQILGHRTLEMVRRYVNAANVQQSLLERRSTPMDLLTQPPGSQNQRRRQPRNRRGLRVVR